MNSEIAVGVLFINRSYRSCLPHANQRVNVDCQSIRTNILISAVSEVRTTASGGPGALPGKGAEWSSRMLYTIIGVLLVLWLLGFIGHIGGGLIHLLLVIAVVVFLFNLISGRRTAV